MSITTKSIVITSAVIIIIGTIISISVLGSCGGSGAPPITQYTLTIHLETTMAVGDNTITGTGIYDEGSVVNIRANPETGWEFIEWTGNIVTVTNRFLNNTEIVMNGDYDITAHFTYPVTVSYTHLTLPTTPYV